MTHDPNQTDLEVLDTLILAYGADRSIWPADAVRRLTQSRQDPHAVARLLREAAALDQVMAAAADGAATPARPQLTDRIMMALPARAPAQAAATIVAMTDHMSRRQRPVTRARRSELPIGAASVLAASLLIGVIAGTAGYDSVVAQDLTARLGISDLVYTDTGWGGDGHGAAEEEDAL